MLILRYNIWVTHVTCMYIYTYDIYLLILRTAPTFSDIFFPYMHSANACRYMNNCAEYFPSHTQASYYNCSTRCQIFSAL